MDSHRPNATRAIRARMSERGLRSNRQLAELAGLSTDTLADFLAGRRTPQSGTLSAISTALGWEPDHVERLLDGFDDSQTPTTDSGVLLDLPKDALAGLGVLEQEEVRASAVAAALKKIREIRASEN